METKLPLVKEKQVKDLIKKMDGEGNIVSYLVIDFDIWTSEEERANQRAEVLSKLNYVNQSKGFTFSTI